MRTRNPLASTLIQRVSDGIAGGVQVVQLREKETSAGELYELAQQLRYVTEERALLLVNDRIDVALAVGADGVHLPGDGLPVAAARRLLGEDKLIGCSVHSVASAAQCAQAGADFVHVGTIYATDSKPGRAPAGPQLVRAVAAAIDIPAIAVDTHVRRVTGRIGLTTQTDPVKIERDLKALYPTKVWTGVSMRFIQFGRDICDARAPRCEECEMARDRLCDWPARS